MRIGKLDIYARTELPALRWAWLAVVKEGPSIEAVAGPLTVTVSWGLARETDPPARVWAWRRARKVALCGASAGEG